ncbi:TetR/AcrR family transcriptional regulator, regulator of mycofactocin system [Frankia sp. AiPs1]|uniref:acyl-CoA-like ligand-binding transcription factor n=1 Tax=Frankia sp. AiPa1 TaxID=573492 RepID=UPI00202B8F73|nr:TetR family transcriptional regulator [Frankia sp. AiPa1]MCL9762138.1 TetR family transcriptional regulator [Frankia sp. AiPa1]
MTHTPQQASVAAIEKAALEMIAARGFQDVTVEEIANAAGVSRRTFFRYFASKNDILFGNFAELLQELDDWFTSVPDDRPMFDAIAEGVMRFNRANTDGPVVHRQRMELIMFTPALKANASLRNAEWLAVIARYTARRLDEPEDALGPQLIGHVSLGAANAAYERWLRAPGADLNELVRRAFRMARTLAELDITTTQSSWRLDREPFKGS